MATSNETATYIGDLPTSPTVPVDATAGGRSRGGAEIRKTKAIMKASFPSVTGAVTATHTELNILDGVTATAAELNILDGVTSTAAELNILDGVTATAAELNILDGVTSTAAELNVLDGVTAFIDDDSMATAAATNIPSAESVKAYVDAQLSSATVTLMNPHAVSTVGSAVAHGLGAEPTSMLVYIECLTTDAGYSAGDKVWVETANATLSVNFDATNVQAIQSNNNLQVAHKTTTVATNITSANWKLMAKVSAL